MPTTRIILRQFQISYPYHFIRCVKIIYGGGVFCLVFSGLPLWFCAILALLCGFHLAYWQLNVHSWVTMVWMGGSRWILSNKQGQSYQVLVLGSSIRTRQWVILHLQKISALQRIYLVIYKKDMTDQEFRHLRICLLDKT